LATFFGEKLFYENFVAWLSITFTFGLYLFASTISKLALYAVKMLLSSRLVIGVANIEFVL
jgi:hypothetical protein